MLMNNSSDKCFFNSSLQASSSSNSSSSSPLANTVLVLDLLENAVHTGAMSSDFATSVFESWLVNRRQSGRASISHHRDHRDECFHYDTPTSNDDSSSSSSSPGGGVQSSWTWPTLQFSQSPLSTTTNNASSRQEKSLSSFVAPTTMASTTAGQQHSFSSQTSSPRMENRCLPPTDVTTNTSSSSSSTLNTNTTTTSIISTTNLSQKLPITDIELHSKKLKKNLLSSLSKLFACYSMEKNEENKKETIKQIEEKYVAIKSTTISRPESLHRQLSSFSFRGPLPPQPQPLNHIELISQEENEETNNILTNSSGNHPYAIYFRSDLPLSTSSSSSSSPMNSSTTKTKATTTGGGEQEVLTMSFVTGGGGGGLGRAGGNYKFKLNKLKPTTEEIYEEMDDLLGNNNNNNNDPCALGNGHDSGFGSQQGQTPGSID